MKTHSVKDFKVGEEVIINTGAHKGSKGVVTFVGTNILEIEKKPTSPNGRVMFLGAPAHGEVLKVENDKKNHNPMPIAKYGLIEGEVFNLQEKLAERWVGIFPNGVLPDRIGYLLSEVMREWYRLLHAAKKEQQALKASRLASDFFHARAERGKP